ncbi:hypothetical protein M6B38_348825 [Iris pallida]|uniref:Uncharacterized protein n=1 Tax=Iris pallida TaxID=29817 RepID=A0AAX6GRZ7_IRIPA|nr:hypothetical protein M6B38_348825 [Iris pallida]
MPRPGLRTDAAAPPSDRPDPPPLDGSTANDEASTATSLTRPSERPDLDNRRWNHRLAAEFLAIDPSAIVILYIHAVLLTCFQGEASTLTRLVLYFLSYLHVPCSHIGHELHTIVLYHCSLLVSHCSLRDWGKY